jgi:hypothetical protein
VVFLRRILSAENLWCDKTIGAASISFENILGDRKTAALHTSKLFCLTRKEEKKKISWKMMKSWIVNWPFHFRQNWVLPNVVIYLHSSTQKLTCWFYCWQKEERNGVNSYIKEKINQEKNYVNRSKEWSEVEILDIRDWERNNRKEFQNTDLLFRSNHFSYYIQYRATF